ncbi:MAG: 3-dehydroquinate synthase [Terriglobales bacterium]
MQLPALVAPAYSISLGRGLLAEAGALVVRHRPAGGQVVVITAAPVRAAWGGMLEAALAQNGLAACVLELPDGEPHKNLSQLETLAEAMVASGAGRDAVVVAFGGGVVGDVAALLASLYMRGVGLIHIPTTLVAMVDSALGGKTGVNLAAGKNLLGSFHHPQAMLVDPALLTTLDNRQYRSGMAEAIKYGIIGDAHLFAYVVEHAAALAGREPEPLERMIAACLRQKAAIVAADEREAGLRRILNFGHTLGHALESATAYTRFLHGEAVAWGMLAATRIAVRMGLCAETEGDRICTAVLCVCAPLPRLEVEPAELLRHAASDKKTRAGTLHWVLPRAVGKVEVVAGVPDAVVKLAVRDAVNVAAEA